MRDIPGCGRAAESTIQSCHSKLLSTIVDLISTCVHKADSRMIVMRALTVIVSVSDSKTVSESGVLRLLDEYWCGDFGAKIYTKDSRYDQKCVYVKARAFMVHEIIV
jgi:hypothetical protein